MWHNYGFDRHVLGNHSRDELRIDCRGFDGDTMHMARLWNSSRQGKGYSLEALSTDVDIIVRELGEDMARFSQLDGDFEGKVSMRTLFGERLKRKDGSQGKQVRRPGARLPPAPCSCLPPGLPPPSLHQLALRNGALRMAHNPR